MSFVLFALRIIAAIFDCCSIAAALGCAAAKLGARAPETQKGVGVLLFVIGVVLLFVVGIAAMTMSEHVFAAIRNALLVLLVMLFVDTSRGSGHAALFVVAATVC